MRTPTHLRLLLLALSSATVAWAADALPQKNGWGGLAREISREQALAILQPVEGSPLLVTRSRDGKFEVWNYDCGAYLLFVGGALDYWSTPQTDPA